MIAKRAILINQTITGPSTVNGDSLDVMHFHLVSVAFNIAAGGTLTGTCKLQWSNDNVNWVDIPSATATLSTTNPLMINVSDVGTAFIRPVITSTAGTSTITAIAIAKGI